MNANESRKEQAKEGYGNLGSDTQGLQKMMNDKARGEVLKEFASEIDAHDVKRLPKTDSPLNNLSVPKKEAIQEEHLVPIDFDERLNKFLRE